MAEQADVLRADEVQEQDPVIARNLRILERAYIPNTPPYKTKVKKKSQKIIMEFFKVLEVEGKKVAMFGCMQRTLYMIRKQENLFQ